MSAAFDESIALGSRGRMVLPAAIRRRLGLREGERLLVRADDDGTICLVSYRAVAEQSRGLFADLSPNRSLTEELTRERRAEAAREGAD